MLVSLVSFLLQPLDQAGTPGPVWARITRQPAGQLEAQKFEFGTLGVVRGRPERLLYFARRTATRFRQIPEVRWADSRSCPAILQVLADLRALPTPSVDVPGFPSQLYGTDRGIMLDGVSYVLTLSGITYSMNVNSPLSAWTESTVTRLAACWHTDMPTPQR